MAHLRLYRTYRYIDKDPVIDEIRTLVQDEGLMKKLDIVHQLSGVATQTLQNWFGGNTKSPQNRTICAVTSCLGYERAWQKKKKIDIEQELKVAARWAQQQNSNKDRKKTKTKPANGHAHRAGAPR